MDKSVDSIGSCSLDVDADSSDISDTSGSLNFPTPISIKDITKDFTANIHERCTTVRKVHMQTILNQPTCTITSPSALNQTTSTSTSTTTSAVAAATVECDKKPSYLNLACCVNGYSNITTYDSKIRQDINKSREVSPIRPSSSSIQYCKRNDCLAPPELQKMPNPNMNGSSSVNIKQKTSKIIYNNNNNNNCQENGHHQTVIANSGEQQFSGDGKQRSFIQQRVERLYGPGALAQGFYSPKKVRDSSRSSSFDQDKEFEDSELTNKFKQLSMSKDYGEFRKKIHDTESQTSRMSLENNADNNNIDLPVLRHLSHEFRAQLPKISPKRNIVRSPPSENTCPNTNMMMVNAAKANFDNKKNEANEADEVDHKNVSNTAMLEIEINDNNKKMADNNSIGGRHAIDEETRIFVETQKSLNESDELNTPHIAAPVPAPAPQNDKNEEHLKRDGHYFLKLLKTEQERLLLLANDAEKNIELLTGQPDITEEIFGLLRSASGKARLLVSQKMKQFEGLCHKNVNDIPGEKFPTTADDLQGFWDMVNLQIDQIDSIFAELELLKKYGWMKKEDEITPAASPKKSKPNNSRIATPKANRTSIKSQATMSAAALKRESQRKQLMEIKRKNRLTLAASAANADSNKSNNIPDNVGKNSIEIFINENQS